MTSYVKELASLDTEIKRLNKVRKSLNEQRKLCKQRLYEYMKSRNMEEFEGVKIEKITPKTTAKRKPEKQKRKDAINLFNEIGIPDPEDFFNKFIQTQKNNVQSQQNVDNEHQEENDIEQVSDDESHADVL